MNKKALVISALLLAAISRLLPHPSNFTPLAAMALFGGAYLSNRLFAVFIVLLSLLFSDVLVNTFLYQNIDAFGHFSGGYFIPVYLSTFLLVFLGFGIKNKISAVTVAGTSVAGSLVFWIITNFACWPGNPLYSQDLSGLLQCYSAALPFLNSIIGDLFFNAILFGGYYLIGKKNPAIA